MTRGGGAARLDFNHGVGLVAFTWAWLKTNLSNSNSSEEYSTATGDTIRRKSDDEDEDAPDQGVERVSVIK